MYLQIHRRSIRVVVAQLFTALSDVMKYSIRPLSKLMLYLIAEGSTVNERLVGNLVLSENYALNPIILPTLLYKCAVGSSVAILTEAIAHTARTAFYLYLIAEGTAVSSPIMFESV